jgi:hypothetical protein
MGGEESIEGREGVFDELDVCVLGIAEVGEYCREGVGNMGAADTVVDVNQDVGSCVKPVVTGWDNSGCSAFVMCPTIARSLRYNVPLAFQ